MTNPKKNIKVLIVEDDPDICDIYAATFMRDGFTVYTARDGDGAIDKWNKKNPDIVLLDIMMPGSNGYDVLKEVRKTIKTYTPVIMLTNLDSSHFEKHANFEDVDAYLIKSNFTPSEVLKKTKAIMEVNKLL